MVIGLPVLLVVLFAGLEFSWAFDKKAGVTEAARAAARAASLAGSTRADVEVVVGEHLEKIGFPANTWTLEMVPADPEFVEPGTPISVHIIADYSAVSLGGLGDWFLLPENLNAAAVMRKEGH
jgi:hypothetical protein